MSEIIGGFLFLIGLFLGYRWGKEGYKQKVETAVWSWEGRNKVRELKKYTLKEWLIKYLDLNISANP
jgi:hypothetical protein